jgi:hypothetical protein
MSPLRQLAHVAPAHSAVVCKTIDDDALEQSVVDCAIDYPEALVVFEEYGIDYSCAGKSLKQSCLSVGADPFKVAARIRLAVR